MALALDFKSTASADAVRRSIGESTRAGPEISEIARVRSSFDGNAFELRYTVQAGGREDPKPVMRGNIEPRPDGGCDICVEIGYGIAAPAAVVGFFTTIALAILAVSRLGWLILAVALGVGIFYVHRERHVSVDDRDIRRLAEGLEAAIRSAQTGRMAKPVGMTKHDEAEAAQELAKIYQDLDRR